MKVLATRNFDSSKVMVEHTPSCLTAEIFYSNLHYREIIFSRVGDKFTVLSIVTAIVRSKPCALRGYFSCLTITQSMLSSIVIANSWLWWKNKTPVIESLACFGVDLRVVCKTWSVGAWTKLRRSAAEIKYIVENPFQIHRQRIVKWQWWGRVGKVIIILASKMRHFEWVMKMKRQSIPGGFVVFLVTQVCI